MNRIVRKTLDGLEKLEPFLRRNGKDDALEIINNLKRAIDLDHSLQGVNRMLDSYEAIEVLLYDTCNLTDEEAGYIIDKVLKFNFTVNASGNYIIIMTDELEKYGLDINKVKVLMEKINNDSSDLTEEEKKMYSDILDSESKKNEYIKDALKIVEDFTKKESHTEDEYNILVKSLKTLYLPERMIESYVLFYRKKEKEEKTFKPTTIKRQETKKEENIPSRRILKNRLNELYHPDEIMPYFDLKDIKEVIKLLRLLNISDERVEMTLNDLYSAAIKNESYYNFLIEKIKYMNIHIDKLEEINELKKMYETSNEEERHDIKIWLNELYEQLEFEIINSFEYEMKYNCD